MKERELLDSGIIDIFFLLFYSDTELYEIEDKARKFAEQNKGTVVFEMNDRRNLKLIGPRYKLATFLSSLKGKTLAKKLGCFCRHIKADEGWILPAKQN